MMKKGNATILASIFVMALVAAGVGAGTMAYFSDTVRRDGNSFTSGILDMTPVLFGPVVLTNLKPGDTFDWAIALKNTGDIDIKYLVMRDENLAYHGGYLGTEIEITSFDEYKIYPDGVSVAYGPETCSGSAYESWLNAADCDGGAYDTHLSLNEWFIGYPPGKVGSNDLWDVVTLSANWGGGVLEVGYTYKMVLHLKFMETGHPQDGYQHSWISFDWVVMGTHADKTEIEGYLTH